MQLPKYVLVKPSFGKHTPLFGKYIANSIGPFIFLPKHIYDDLQSEKPKPYHIALLIHEQTHRKRQKDMGFLKFGVKYVFDSKFRFNEELIAIKEAMKHLKKNNIPFDFDTKAKFLSSYLYLWPVSKHYAKDQLKKVWDEI